MPYKFAFNRDEMGAVSGTSSETKGLKLVSRRALTARESEVLSHIANGETTHDIAERLGIAFKTVASHRHRILEKLQANNAAQMIRIGTELGLVATTQVAAPTQDVGT